MGRFEGRVAMITGCGKYRGLGRTIALAFAEEGADIVVTDLHLRGTRQPGEEEPSSTSWNGLESLVAEIHALGTKALAVVGDVSQRSDVERMVAEALHRFGRVDFLINNAAAPQGADRAFFWEIPEEAWNQVLAVNLTGAFFMSQTVARNMLTRGEGGRIVNIASISGKVGTSKRAAYDSSKFGLIGLTQVMGMELAPHGITVNAICPGAISTDRQAATLRRQEKEKKLPNAAPAFSRPISRPGEPADVARMAVFLAADESDYITRQSINIDGGMITV